MVTRHDLDADLQEAHHALRVEVDDERRIEFDVDGGQLRRGRLALLVLLAFALFLLRILGVVLAFVGFRDSFLVVGVALVHEEERTTARGAEGDHGSGNDDQELLLAALGGSRLLLVLVFGSSFGRCSVGIRHRSILAEELRARGGARRMPVGSAVT